MRFLSKLRVNLDKRELKAHGTYEFPVNISRKRLSSYGTGSFPWHWHDEVELTLVLSGEIDYRVNDSRYLLKAGEGLFCNADALHSGCRVESGQDCDYVSLTFHPRLLGGYEGCVIRRKFVDRIVSSGALPSLRLSPEEPWQARALEALQALYWPFPKTGRRPMSSRCSGCFWAFGGTCTATGRTRARPPLTRSGWSACGSSSPTFTKTTGRRSPWRTWQSRWGCAKASAAGFSGGRCASPCSSTC